MRSGLISAKIIERMQKSPYVIAFDADDTLWDHESYFVETREQIAKKLSKYISSKALEDQLYQVEKRNIPIFGYGVKGFMISVIETATEISNGEVTAQEIREIIDLGKDLMAHPIKLRPYVKETIKELSHNNSLTLITKGDLFHQESKIAISGIGHYFNQIEIVGEKNLETYQKFLNKEAIAPENFLMIGNSLRSDILPVIQIGGTGIYIPSGYIWAHDEVHENAFIENKYIEIDSMKECHDHVVEWLSQRSIRPVNKPNHSF